MTKIITFDPAVYRLVPLDIAQKISHALHCADVLIDAVPTRLQESSNEQLANIGDLVNNKGVYQIVATAKKEFYDFLASAPDTLPGVVEHSGEPVAWCRRDTVIEWKDQLFNITNMFPSKFGLKDPLPLFTHPPAQPDTAALQAWIAELEAALHRAETVIYMPQKESK
jgi:hypothetical protein